MPGETSRCRERLKRFCVGYGLDIGYGGDPIVPGAITVDLPQPYTKVGGAPLNLGGDARDLYWFRDEVFDYVYSSHLLEDFEDTRSVVKEWLRVIKPGGYLILFCPDEQVYRRHCRKTGQAYNCAHKIDNFSLAYVKQILLECSRGAEVVHETPLVDDYSFELVVRKKGSLRSVLSRMKNAPAASHHSSPAVAEALIPGQTQIVTEETLEIARGYFERMEYRDNKFVVSGWMLLPEKGFESFVIYINSCKGQETIPVEREDVAKVFHFIPHAGNSGFLFMLDRHPEEMQGTIDLRVVGCVRGVEIAKMETWFRTDQYSLPVPPAHLILRASAHKLPSFYLITGMQTYREFWTAVCKHADPRSINSMLDWGCGCGRVTGFFIKLSGIPRIAGCDIDAEAIAWCRDSLGPAEFSVAPLYPPTAFANNSFDLVVSFSVLSHLSKELQLSWLKEMERILTPGGLFLATLHGEFATRFCFPEKDVREVLKGSLYSVDDGGLDNVAPKGYYKGAFQAKEYTLREWSVSFEVLEYRERGGGNYQDLIVMRKRTR